MINRSCMNAEQWTVSMVFPTWKCQWSQCNVTMLPNYYEFFCRCECLKCLGREQWNTKKCWQMIKLQSFSGQMTIELTSFCYIKTDIHFYFRNFYVFWPQSIGGKLQFSVLSENLVVCQKLWWFVIPRLGR